MGVDHHNPQLGGSFAARKGKERSLVMKELSKESWERLSGCSTEEILEASGADGPCDAFYVADMPLRDAVRTFPCNHYHDGSMGLSKEIKMVFALTSAGKLLHFDGREEASWRSNYAYSQPSKQSGSPASWDWVKVRALIVYDRDIDDWPGRESIDSRTLTYFRVAQLSEGATKTLRRRIEDALRKRVAPEVLLKLGADLDVKLYDLI